MNGAGSTDGEGNESSEGTIIPKNVSVVNSEEEEEVDGMRAAMLDTIEAMPWDQKLTAKSAYYVMGSEIPAMSVFLPGGDPVAQGHTYGR